MSQPRPSPRPRAKKASGPSAVVPATSPPPASAGEARVALEAARAGFAADLDGLTAAARSSLDIKAKVRREPVKSAALVGGAGFLLLGGPRRVLRAATSRIGRRRRVPADGLLPEEIERILHDTGAAQTPGLREAIAADFADYLQAKGKAVPPPGPASAFWRTYDAMANPLGRAAAWLLVRRLLASRAVQELETDERPGTVRPPGA